jgi:ATP-dependent DNA helicase RecG
LQAQVALGEDSRRQCKQDMQSPDALAAEMAAFANSEGGVILLGVADDGSLLGLSLADVSRLNQMISDIHGSAYLVEKLGMNYRDMRY